jgi:hypothetical protein
MSVAIRGYYDKSENKARITLAGYAAPPAVWTRFNELWLSVLGNAPVQPCRYLHMVEAKGLRDAFGRALGWDDNKVAALLRELVNKCFAPFGWSDGEERIFAAYCTIEKDDYERACQEIPHLKDKRPAAICAE